MKNEIEIKKIIDYIKYNTVFTELKNILSIYKQLKNKNEIYKIIDILNNDFENNYKNNDFEIKNKNEILNVFDKIIKLIENNKKSSFTIQFPNEKILSVNFENFNYLEDIERLYDFFEDSLHNYDLILNPIIFVKKENSKLSFKNKQTAIYSSYIINTKEIIKQSKDETKEMLQDFLDEDMNYIFE